MRRPFARCHAHSAAASRNTLPDSQQLPGNEYKSAQRLSTGLSGMSPASLLQGVDRQFAHFPLAARSLQLMASRYHPSPGATCKKWKQALVEGSGAGQSASTTRTAIPAWPSPRDPSGSPTSSMACDSSLGEAEARRTWALKTAQRAQPSPVSPVPIEESTKHPQTAAPPEKRVQSRAEIHLTLAGFI